MLDKNGEPLVVYHNTSQDFTVFDSSQARQNMDIPALFFSANPENSLDYGDISIQAFLNIRNLTEKPYLGTKLGFEAKAELEEGYDSTILDDSDEDYIDIEYAAFYANQIKSATHNIGTFDKNNADIHVSALPAVPYVLENSVVIEKSKDKNAKDIENYILASPINIDNERHYVVVRLKKDLDKDKNPKFYIVSAETVTEAQKMRLLSLRPVQPKMGI